MIANQPFAEMLDLAATGDGGVAGKRWADHWRFPGAPFELPQPGDRWVRVREQRLHDGRWIGTHVDVTDLCRMQRSLDEARQRAEELAAMLNSEIQERKRAEAQIVQAARLLSLGQMATGLAHALNQPLAVMAPAADNAITSCGRPAQPPSRRRWSAWRASPTAACSRAAWWTICAFSGAPMTRRPPRSP